MFSCKMCGKCCRSLRGRLGTKPPQRYFQRMYMLVRPQDMTITLFEWEVVRMMENAKKSGVKLLIQPSIVCFDEISQKVLAFGWSLDHDDCPFLDDDNKCSIYKQRPMTCQAFPLYSAGISDYLQGNIIRMNVGECPYKILPSVGTTQFDRYLLDMHRLYGSTFIGAMKIDMANRFIRWIGGQLKARKAIRRARMTKKTVKKIRRQKPVGFIGYAMHKGLLTPNVLEDHIREIETADANTLDMLLGLWRFL